MTKSVKFIKILNKMSKKFWGDWRKKFEKFNDEKILATFQKNCGKLCR